MDYSLNTKVKFDDIFGGFISSDYILPLFDNKQHEKLDGYFMNSSGYEIDEHQISVIHITQ